MGGHNLSQAHLQHPGNNSKYSRESAVPTTTALARSTFRERADPVSGALGARNEIEQQQVQAITSAVLGAVAPNRNPRVRWLPYQIQAPHRAPKLEVELRPIGSEVAVVVCLGFADGVKKQLHGSD